MRLSSRYVLTFAFSLCLCVAIYGVLIGRLNVALFTRKDHSTNTPTESTLVKDVHKGLLEVDKVNPKDVADLPAGPEVQIQYAKPQKGDIFPKIEPFLVDVSKGVVVSAEEFCKSPGVTTGNRLIDDYGHNDLGRIGEKGRGVTFVGHEEEMAKSYVETFRVNVMASDLITLHRTVPDSRPPG